MPELVEQMYCSQQIVIPPKYPYILKRYCKAAIKTQPYDLLRWSFEYFRALAEHRAPPVKLRLEYPVYSTEGGLTRGCLKVLAQQLNGMTEIPMATLKQAWQGFCLDPIELSRILCMCEVYLRKESVPYLHFLAVAGGLLTKCLTHTMILLCESLTKEPDGGSAAIPVKDFLVMYNFLARIDASKEVKYHNGHKEGEIPESEKSVEEEEIDGSEQGKSEVERQKAIDIASDVDDFWQDKELHKVGLIDDHVGRTTRLSVKMNLPVIGKIERSPSIERASEQERDKYMRERKGRPAPSDDVERKLKELSAGKTPQDDKVPKEVPRSRPVEEERHGEKKDTVDIYVYDEDDNAVTYEIYGEPSDDYDYDMADYAFEATTVTAGNEDAPQVEGQANDEGSAIKNEAERVALFIARVSQMRQDRITDIEQTLEEIANIVDKFETANYDLGMVAGRQMSTTSGEFIVQHIEKEIMAYIDDQIAILPDPDLKKKKAKPEEVVMVRDILEQFLEDNMSAIVPDIEEVEEEEAPIPEIIVVYAVPGIGGPVDIDIVTDFEDYVMEVSRIQADMIMPRNIRHFLCPPLEKYIEHEYIVKPNKEELPTGGAFAE